MVFVCRNGLNTSGQSLNEIATAIPVPLDYSRRLTKITYNEVRISATTIKSDKTSEILFVELRIVYLAVIGIFIIAGSFQTSIAIPTKTLVSTAKICP